MKTMSALGFILTLAVTPRNLLLWGCLLLVCAGMYIAADRAEATKRAPGRADTRTDAGDGQSIPTDRLHHIKKRREMQNEN